MIACGDLSSRTAVSRSCSGWVGGSLNRINESTDRSAGPQCFSADDFKSRGVLLGPVRLLHESGRARLNFIG
jgi:hypothetical protein